MTVKSLCSGNFQARSVFQKFVCFKCDIFWLLSRWETSYKSYPIIKWLLFYCLKKLFIFHERLALFPQENFVFQQKISSQFSLEFSGICFICRGKFYIFATMNMKQKQQKKIMMSNEGYKTMHTMKTYVAIYQCVYVCTACCLLSFLRNFVIFRSRVIMRLCVFRR